MNILIIGAGFLGQALAKSLKASGHTLVGTTRSKEKFPYLKLIFDKVVLWNEETTLTAFEQIDSVILTAASSDYKAAYLDNALLIQKATFSYPQIRHVLYSSSTSVYGEKEGALVNEMSTLNPLTSSTEILIETEKVLLSLPICKTIFRLGELVGKQRTLETRLANMQGNAFAGTGESVTNLSPLEDVVRAFEFAIARSLDGVYNLCSEIHASRKELYTHIAEARNLSVKFDPSLSSLHAGNKWVCSHKIKAAGFQFKASLTEGILNSNFIT